MNSRAVLVTGAAGFLGRHLVRALIDAKCRVTAGVHHEHDRRLFTGLREVQPVTLDIRDAGSLRDAMAGADHVYHCAALVDSRASRERLLEVNASGTRLVWECAAASGVKKAMYCSSAAVYGLLARSGTGITEEVRARAIEPYGYSKRLGEIAALDVAERMGVHTTIIRPVAIFGPGEHTPFGKKLRNAVLSKVLIAGGFQGKQFSFVHVHDVAAAAVHLMDQDLPSGEIYNVAVNKPIMFEEAFRAYARVLLIAGRSYAKGRLFATISTQLHNHPVALKRMSALVGDRFMFRIWHPGFDITYSSAKLLGTAFRFTWENFEEVLGSCVETDDTWKDSSPSAHLTMSQNS